MPTSNHVNVGVREQALRQYWEDDFTPLQAAGKSILSALRQDESAPDADLYRRITSGSSTTRPSSSTSSSSSLDIPGHRYFGMDDMTTTTTSSTAAASATGTPNSGSSRGGGTGGGKNSKGTSFLNMRHERSVPLPSYLAQQLKATKVSTYMGLFPEADLAWMTVDDSLYLWSYTGTRSNFAGPSTALTLVNNNQQHQYPNNDGTMEDFLSFTVPTHRPIVSVGLVPPKPGT
jgi:nuclear pore complex protein Nup155